MKQLFIFIILISLFITCSKEKGNTIFGNYCSPTETGPTIPPYNKVGFGYKYVNILENNSYYPCINPLNPNEFVYILSYTGRSGLYKYDITRKNTTLIIKFVPNNYTAFPSTYARWSRKGWLIFTDLYSNVYKIKDNGDSLTQLTFTSSDFKPEWNYDGTIFCTQHYNNLLNQHFTIIRSEQGAELDTIQYGIIQPIGSPMSWNKENIILGTNDNGIILFDYNNKIVKEIPTNISITFPKWINGVEFIYNGINGIFIYNIINNKVKQIRSNPNSNRYDYVNMLPNNQMICERNYTNLIDSENAVIASKTNICIINPCDTVVTDFDLK